MINSSSSSATQQATDGARLPFVRLRAMEPEDLDTLYDIENDPALWAVGATNVPYSKYILRDYVANATNDIYADRQVRLMAENRQQQVVAVVDMVNFEPQHLRAELGIVVKKTYRRQGYADAIIGSVVEYARRIIHLHQLYAVVQSSNVAALQLFQKHQFLHQSTLKDWLFDGSDYHDAYVLQRFL